MTALDPHLPCFSPGSATLETVTREEIVKELARELHYRRAYYEKRVAKGLMSADDAEREIDIMAAIHADLACGVSQPGGPREWRDRRAHADAALAAWYWNDLVGCLRREIAMRRAFYPKWIAKGTLDAATARRQLERIECAHYHYWFLCRAFWPAELGHWRTDDQRAEPWTAEQHAIWARAIRAHRARFDPAPDNWRGLYRGARADPLPAQQAELRL